jgi:hypothetical protein
MWKLAIFETQKKQSVIFLCDVFEFKLIWTNYLVHNWKWLQKDEISSIHFIACGWAFKTSDILRPWHTHQAYKKRIVNLSNTFLHITVWKGLNVWLQNITNCTWKKRSSFLGTKSYKNYSRCFFLCIQWLMQMREKLHSRTTNKRNITMFKDR